MRPFQQRVLDEKEELDNKAARLCAFLEDDEHIGVSTDELDRLTWQYHAMRMYSYILNERIKNFKIGD